MIQIYFQAVFSLKCTTYLYFGKPSFFFQVMFPSKLIFPIYENDPNFIFN